MIQYEEDNPIKEDKPIETNDGIIGTDFMKKIKTEYLSEGLKKIVKFKDGRIQNSIKDNITHTVESPDRNNQIKNEKISVLENNQINIKCLSFLIKQENNITRNLDLDFDKISITFTELNDNFNQENEINQQEQDIKNGTEECDKNILNNEKKTEEKNNFSSNNIVINNISNISHIQHYIDDEESSFFFENSQGEIENYKISPKKKKQKKIIDDSPLDYITLDAAIANDILAWKPYRKWDDHLNNPNLVKGKFSKEESIKLIKEIVRYGDRRNLEFSTLMTHLLDRKVRSNSPIWCEVAIALPNRSIKSICDYCHRIFNPNNNKGLWSEEDTEKLIQLYNELGGRWKLIGDILQRHPENVRDKWKNLYKIKSDERKLDLEKPWTLLMTLKLLKYVNDYVNEYYDSEKTILKWGYKFSKMFRSGDFEGDRYLDEGEEILFLDYRIKNFSQKILINVSY
jgi:hypothetical protein